MATTGPIDNAGSSGAAASAEPNRTAIWGWGIGSLGVALLYNTTNLLLLRYLVDFVGIAAAMASSLVAFSKIYDAVTDPLMGVISDRTKSRWGRRRPWLLLGAVFSTLALPILFINPGFEGTGLLIWVTFGLLFYATAYTIFSVPYMAMPAEMSDDPYMRSVIFGWRVRAIAIGQFLAGAAAPAIIAYYGGGEDGHAMMAVALGCLIFISMVACFTFTGGARALPITQGEQRGFFSQAKSLLADHNLTWLLIAKMLHLVAVAFAGATLAFYTLRVLELPDTALAAISAMATIAMLLTTGLLAKLSKKIGKQQTYFLSVAIFALVHLCWYIMPVGAPVYMIGAVGFFAGIGGAGMMLMAQSLLADVMSDDRYRTGHSREGIYAGFYTTIEKLSFAVGIVLVGFVLQAFGYIEGQGLTGEQPPEALFAIRVCVSFAPAILAVLGAFAMMKVKPMNYASRQEAAAS